ncbi:MAG: bifunctional diaminohydroxyphosphoribosylaminopyrimidine deaminase/5-amino-6-(5-phosphoribosylamino)uracil reductase RibD [Acidobacteria bacterium]|nr:MAG: bifunctional diaminohydroxyphosphoribosylaminopyrimidine deaminase/5-amino-6-(5-phosphoribosylamino)uracil reductase RibD [Acidobacteriota bacterium]
MSRAEDLLFLRRAIELADRAGRAAAPNPRVGAVIVRGSEVVGEGWHERAGEAHAEVRALEAAGPEAAGATLYASLEPCAHTGRTPPCCRAIAAAGIARVVVPLVDPDPRVNGRGLAALREAGIATELAGDPEVTAAARRVLEDYLVHRAEGRAFLVWKVAASLDGRIADAAGMARWITGPAARERGRSLRDRFGAVIVGAGTIAADDPILLPPTRPPEGGPFLRCVIDGRLRVDPGARIFDDSSAPVVVYTRDDVDPQRAAAVEARGAEVVRTPAGPDGRIRPEAVLADLARRDVLGAVLEGGGSTAGPFLAAGVVDKVLWFSAARILGAGGRPAVGEVSFPLGESPRFRIAGLERIGEDVLLTLERERSEEPCSPDSSAT